MKMWLVSRALQWEGDYPQGVLSDDGLKKYLSDKPAFHDDGYGGYTTHQNDSEWFYITPWDVDSLVNG